MNLLSFKSRATLLLLLSWLLLMGNNTSGTEQLYDQTPRFSVYTVDAIHVTERRLLRFRQFSGYFAQRHQV